MIVPVPAIAFPIAALVGVAAVVGVWFGGVSHGKFVERAAYTELELAEANANLKASQAAQTEAQKAGEKHNEAVQVVHNTTREIIRTVTIPPDRDPILPVWFVRLLDRAAGRTIDGDPYPGKSDGDPSDVTLSEAGRLLAGVGGWADLYSQCRQQVQDTAALKPVMPAPAVPEPGILDRINPFN